LNTKLIEIASRIKSLREILEISVEEVCKKTDISIEDYNMIEAGTKDFSATFIIKLAEIFNVDTTDLLTGKSPTLSTFALSRNGEGLSMIRRKGFEYKNLAYNFKNKHAEPFYVTAPYLEEEQNKSISLSTHEGQEFDYILKGSLKVQINNKIEILNAGDSIYYDSSNYHGMIAVGGNPCEFLAIVIKK
jgi:transcriptional regulator with XRE-family HTH domain